MVQWTRSLPPSLLGRLSKHTHTHTHTHMHTHPKHSQQDERQKLKQVPLVVVVGIEQDKTAREVGVHKVKGEGSRQGSEERSPHHSVGEIVGYLEGGGGGGGGERDKENDVNIDTCILPFYSNLFQTEQQLFLSLFIIPLSYPFSSPPFSLLLSSHLPSTLLPTSSRLNSTPPTGAPKATDTPAAAAAERTSRFLASFW